ncbi:RNA polymerase sigma factor [Nocardioides okcheonensis]|uniref:RNA polymerase sigma factor n=1 Tax=Nocardioides okcheonensis TaxID=2894081 RepID=UPI001E38ECF5|nr:sigma-70 family RNA polymerase sigma factor [Nocardioides okcheonensis]UFN45042.1 sigma-70 family RNA polymerase sigma factor [Nocardioides okcheonensis]
MNSDEERAFTEFVTSSSPRLMIFAQLLFGDPGEAEDALQVALMRLTKHWHRGLEAPTAYVRKALVNIARDRARRRHLIPMLTTFGRVADNPVENQPSATLVRESIEELLADIPPRQRVTVVLRVVEGCSEAETATLMRCAPGTVKSNLARGLERLRENYERREAAYQRCDSDGHVSTDRSPADFPDPYEGASA